MSANSPEDPSRRALFPVLAGAGILLNGSQEASAADTASAAPPFVYGLPTEYREALNIAFNEARQLLPPHGALPCESEGMDEYYKAVRRVGAPLNLPELEKQSEIAQQDLFDDIDGPTRSDADDAIQAVRFEYLTYGHASYVLGLAAGLLIARNGDLR